MITTPKRVVTMDRYPQSQSEKQRSRTRSSDGKPKLDCSGNVELGRRAKCTLEQVEPIAGAL